MSYKVLKEDEQSFHVQHPDGSKFTVAKKGLGGETIAKIKAMGQGMAEGGEPADAGVPADVEAGVPEPKTKEVKVLKAGMGDAFYDPKALADVAASSPEVANAMAKEGVLAHAADAGIEDAPTAGVPAGPDASQSQFSKVMDLAGRTLRNTPQALGALATEAGRVIAPEQTAPMNAPIGANYQLPTGESVVAQPPAAAAPAAQPKTVAKPVPAQVPLTPEQQVATQEMEAQQQVADDQAAKELGIPPDQYKIYKSDPYLQPVINMAIAKVKQDSYFAKQQSGIAQQMAEQNKAIEAKYQAQHDALVADRAKIRSALMTSEVDPKRWWNSKDIGQQMMSSVGMIIAGAGAGLMGGPNQAFEQINRIAERDIRAQEMEIGKKENALTQLMAEGHDAETAADRLKTANMEWAAYQVQKAGLEERDMNNRNSLLGIASVMRQQMEQMALDKIKQRQEIEKNKAAVISSMTSAGYVPTQPQAQQLQKEGWQRNFVTQNDIAQKKMLAQTSNVVDYAEKVWRSNGGDQGNTTSEQDKKSRSALRLAFKNVVESMGYKWDKEGIKQSESDLGMPPDFIYGPLFNTEVRTEARNKDLVEALKSARDFIQAKYATTGSMNLKSDFAPGAVPVAGK